MSNVLVRWKGDFAATVNLPTGPVLIEPGDTFEMSAAEAEQRSDVKVVETAKKPPADSPAKAEK